MDLLLEEEQLLEELLELELDERDELLEELLRQLEDDEEVELGSE